MNGFEPFDFFCLAHDADDEPGASPDAAALAEVFEAQALYDAVRYDPFYPFEKDAAAIEKARIALINARARLAALCAEAGDGVLPFREEDL